MKKTLNINIGNSIIHIEEDAYEMLTVYLNEVKQHFSKNADDFEIVTDIENRIAEMFSEMLANQQKQVVNIDDVQAVTAQMGSVKDFENSEAQDAAEERYANGLKQDHIKKLYRDKDQAMIAGVCAGLGHYLDIEVRWIRLAALLTMLVGGSGILAYLIMWIVIPPAESKSEKMSMRGEAPNLRGFANSHLNPLIKQSRGFIAEVFEFLGNFIQGAGKTIFKAIAIVIVVFGSLLLLFLIGTLAAFLGFWDASIYQYFPLSIVNENYISTLALSTFVVFAIPLLALILFSIRVAFNSNAINKTLSFGLLIIWLGGIVVGVFHIAKISTEFKESAEFTQVSAIAVHKSYFLTVDKTRFFTKADSVRYQIDSDSYKGRKILNDLDGPFDMPKNVRLRIERAENGIPSLIQNYSAQGRTFEAALKEAKNIHYDFLQQDSLLNFSPRLQLANKSNWRDQEVELLLKVPVGTRLYISDEFDRYIKGYDYWNCDGTPNSNFIEWVMTDSGLKCANESKIKEEE